MSGPPRSNLTDPRDRDTLHFDFTAGEDVCGGWVVSRGTEACGSQSLAGFLCSVLAWLWCGRAPAGSGFCDMVGAFVSTILVLWSRTGGSSAPGRRESPASRVRLPRGCGFV